MTQSYARAPLKNGLMLTWRKECFRSSATGLALGIPVHYIWPIPKRGPRPGKLGTLMRYVASIRESFAIIRHEKPDVVVVHNLPVFILMTAMAARLVNRHRIVMDFHSGALTSRVWSKFLPLYRRAIRAAPFILAHNPYDGRAITQMGGQPCHMICLPRDIPGHAPRPARQPEQIMIVCSFAADEPIDMMFEAAKACPDLQFGMTGNFAKRGLTRADAPANVALWGFMERSDYFHEMARSVAIVTLSDRPDIMQMAIHEAVSLGVPVITNHSGTTEPVLEDAGVFCDLTSDSLAAAMRQAVAQQEPLRLAARRLKPRRIADSQAELDTARARTPELFL